MANCVCDPTTRTCAVCGVRDDFCGTPRLCPGSSQRSVALLQPRGPGAELRAILGNFGITASADCKCTSRAAYMDQMGCEWCEANLEEIVGWLRESAADRGLPFLDVAGRLLVRRAIANARRKEAARAEGSPLHPER